MANSKAKAQELKNSYVSGIIDGMRGGELPGAMTQPVVETASTHSFPKEGVVGGINDGDPSHYVHRDGLSVKQGTSPNYANPLDGPEGARGTEKMPPKLQQHLNKYMDRYDIQRYGTGDMVNLPGKMGMELGQTAGVVVDLQNGGLLRKNDGNPRFVIRDGNRRSVQHSESARYPIPNQGFNAFDAGPLPLQFGRQSAEVLHRSPNEVDTTLYRNTTDRIGDMYNEQMYQSFTR